MEGREEGKGKESEWEMGKEEAKEEEEKVGEGEEKGKEEGRKGGKKVQEGREGKEMKSWPRAICECHMLDNESLSVFQEQEGAIPG